MNDDQYEKALLRLCELAGASAWDISALSRLLASNKEAAALLESMVAYHVERGT